MDAIFVLRQLVENYRVQQTSLSVLRRSQVVDRVRLADVITTLKDSNLVKPIIG